MRNKFLKCILIIGLSGICTISFSQKIKYEITLKGKIDNIEEIKPYINEETSLQIVEFKESFTMIFSKGTMMISSEFPMIKIPLDGIVEYKIKNLKYDTKYCIAVQMLNPEFSNVSKVLIIKHPDKDKPSGTFVISKSAGELKTTTEMDLGKFSIVK